MFEINGKKNFLSKIVCNKALLVFVKMLGNKHNLRVLAYHRVMDFNEESYLFDEELISCSMDTFDRQMEFVADNYNVISFDDLTTLIVNNEPLSDNYLIITFDDGYADNYNNAFPILKKYGLKATFFISTDYIDSNEPFWFELITYLSKKNLLTKEFVSHITGNAEISNEEKLIELRRFLIAAPNKQRLDVLSQVRELVNIDLSNPEFDMIRTMTWDQIIEMSKSGMEIGSHSQSHLILGNAELEEIRIELKESKRIIEEKLGKNISTLCYPVGGHEFAINDEVIQQARRLDYNWGVSYFTGINRENNWNKYMLKRIRIERDISDSLFRCSLLFPNLFL